MDGTVQDSRSVTAGEVGSRLWSPRLRLMLRA